MNKIIANAWAQDKEQRAKKEVSKKEIIEAFNLFANDPLNKEHFTQDEMNQIWEWVNNKRNSCPIWQ